MEEEKATEYYNELLHKGGNAARFKQGLGFGAPATSVSKNAPVSNKEEHGSLSNFVKGSLLENDADLHKEIKIENIRNKLQRKEERSKRDCRHPGWVGKKSSGKPESRENARRRGAESCESEERERQESGRLRGSTALGRTERASVQETSNKERTRRSRSPGRSKRRRSSRSSSDDNRSGQTSGRRRRRERDRSVIRVDDSRSRHGRRSSPTGTSRSSHEGRTWDGGHSRSRGRDVDYKGGYRQGRTYSPHSRRERSRSPSPHRNYHENHTQKRSRGRSDHSPVSGSCRRLENDKRDVRSSGRQRNGKMETTILSGFSRAKEKSSERDYSETRGEELTAKSQLQLPDSNSELHENPTMDLTNRTSDNWERFDFDKDAPLDDDAKLDYFGDGTGTSDDTLFLNNTGSSYLSSRSQVKREALVTDKHEAAIFGPREGLSLKTLELDRETVGGKKLKDGVESPRHSVENSEKRDPKIATPLVNSVLSEQVIAMQQGGSWQDRALKMRKAREVALNN